MIKAIIIDGLLKENGEICGSRKYEGFIFKLIKRDGGDFWTPETQVCDPNETFSVVEKKCIKYSKKNLIPFLGMKTYEDVYPFDKEEYLQALKVFFND